MADTPSATTARPAARAGAAQPHTPEPEPHGSSTPAASPVVSASCCNANLPAPTDAPAVRETLAGIARQHAANPATAPRQAAAIAYDAAIRFANRSGFAPV